MKKTRLRYKKFFYSKRGTKIFSTSNEVFSFFTLIFNIFFHFWYVSYKAPPKLRLLFRNVACGKQSSILTTCHNSVENPLILGRNSVFLAPSGMNLIPRYALLHLASLVFRNLLRSVSNSSLQGPKKLNFSPSKNGFTTMLLQVVNKGLIFQVLRPQQRQRTI